MCQFFQDLSSKVDILIDIWGPGHGVDNLTDNNQLALTSRGPHQMNIFIISSLGVCPSRAEVIGDLIIICWGVSFNLASSPTPYGPDATREKNAKKIRYRYRGKSGFKTQYKTGLQMHYIRPQSFCHMNGADTFAIYYR